MWLLAGFYCLLIWLVFDKLRLLKMSLPIAIVAASLGPCLILSLLFCSQYYHPFSKDIHIYQPVVPIVPQVKQSGRVTKVFVEPNVPIKAGDLLFEVDATPYQKTVDRLSAAVQEAKQGVAVAEASVEVAQASYERAKADLKYMEADRDRKTKLAPSGAVSEQVLEQSVTRYQQASSALSVASANLQQVRLSIDAAKARLSQSEASLADAQYDLEQTQVRAPSEGYVTNLQLQPGMMVGGSVGSVMSFVQEPSESNQGVIVALVGQKNYLLVKPSQYAEVALKTYPGKILTGRVLNVIDISGDGQLAATGLLPEDLGIATSSKFAVRIKLDGGEALRVPAGSGGVAAIYTDNVPIAGIPVMFVIRAQSWLNFLF